MNTPPLTTNAAILAGESVNKDPSVSVVMSVFNGEKHLPEAMQSILGQSFTDFEFIIINDGSTDSSQAIVESFQDNRIRLHKQHNQGVVHSLNRGLKEAKAPLVARMDHDDISLPARLERQFDFLKENPDHVLVGSVFEVMDAAGQKLFIEPTPTEDEDIRLTMYLCNPIGHGSTMFRRQVALAAGGYREEYWPTEDYDLWRRMMRHGKVANLSQPLYRWRVSPGGISSMRSGEQLEIVARITDEMWQSGGPTLPSALRMKDRVSFYLSLPDSGRLLANRYVQRNHQLALRLWKRRARLGGTRHLLRLYLSSNFALKQGLRALYSWGKARLRL